MDRNTIIGLSLIGVILVTFTIFNKPSDAEVKAEKAKLEAEHKKETQAEKAQAKKDSIAAASATGKDSTAKAANAPAAPVVAFQPEIIRLESDKLIVDFSTKGGIVSAIRLKEYESYTNFAKKDGKTTPLYLFKDGDQVNQLVFPMGGKDYKTGTKPFTVKKQTKNKLVLEHVVGKGAIEYTYTLKGGYDLGYSVKFRGLGDQVQPKNVLFNWDLAFRKTERLLAEQRKVSTVCYQTADGSMDYLKEVSDDDQQMEQAVNWLAYKQSYFSSIIQPDKPFAANGSKSKVRNYKEGMEDYHSHIRHYNSTMNLSLKSTDNGTVSMNWFFGPNDYNTLKSYGKGYDDILNLGWGLFRWINLYAVQPVFDILNSTGLGIGLSILLLTFILKLLLMPIQWKMFVSSAKMRILKPNIDEINAKYPNKEDAMKKQMDMMALYRESGASPLAGCVPMLVQMPILLAVFRFFPASFELRQKGFLWAEDMSSYDSIFDFGTYIPVYGDHISLFTLLMSATTLVYTYLNSSNVAQQQQPGMPNMKVIMYIFPVMMIFFFNNFAAGLSYYYFISTLMTIILMFVIKRFFVDEEKLKAKMAAARTNSAKNGGVKKKSKFMERMEQMQQQQQQQRKK